MTYGDLVSFEGGLTKILGAPEVGDEARRLAAMRREHCESGDSTQRFTCFQPEAGGTVYTTPMIEWFFVTDPTDARLAELRALPALDPQRTNISLDAWPTEVELTGSSAGSKPRTPRPLSAFDEARSSVNLKLAAFDIGPLTDAELIGIRLYTGTMGKARYNRALRFCASGEEGKQAFEALFDEQCKNRYTTTVHTISDGLKRLGKIASAQTIWRGVCEGMLAPSFFTPNAQGITGGVEFVPAGCAPQEAVSIKWATHDPTLPGVVFEIHQGVDRGADTGVFTDYPELDEVTLPPCTFLEVQGRRVKRNFTTAEGYYHEGAVLYVDVTPQFQQAR